MRSKSLLWTVLCVGTFWASIGEALEKRTVRVDEIEPPDWGAAASCRVSYYNICTGWVWTWGGFPDNSRLGVLVNSCCADGSGSLMQARLFVPTGAGIARGFTGTLSAYAADASGCPTGPALASRPFLPTSLYTVVPFAGDVVPTPFVLIAEVADDSGLGNSATYGSDHPAAGPTGPPACGVCFPATRQTHSFLFGTSDAPLCPGSPFNDGICDAELFWDIDLVCPVDVQESTWGTIKNLYR